MRESGWMDISVGKSRDKLAENAGCAWRRSRACPLAGARCPAGKGTVDGWT
jgi:hypothetical protein